MFIETEATPNPQTLKFRPGREVVPGRAVDFADADGADRSPLAQRIFAVPGVERVFLGGDFITVTKATGEWRELKPQVLGAIMDHFMSGDPVLADAAAPAGGTDDHAGYEGEDAEVVDQIKDLLDTRIRPAVAQDGGDITFHAFKDGVVFLHMRGACAGCPSSTMTLKQGIENMLRHYVPEVDAVEQVL